MEKIVSKCENCGGGLRYDPIKNCLRCVNCETVYYLPVASDESVIVREYSPGFHPTELLSTLRSYKCGGCGNIFYMTSEEISKKCPNCGHSNCSLVRESGYRADGIIPFSISKEEASKKFEDYLKKEKDIPKTLRKYAENQKIMGVYVPVWNFTFELDATFTGTISSVGKYSDGSYYNIYTPTFGEKTMTILSSDALATTIEKDDLVELFDKNDYTKIIPFNDGYTYGYRLDQIDKSVHECYTEMVDAEKAKLEKDIKHKLYSSDKHYKDISVAISERDVFFNFTYVPVYVNTFTYGGNIYKTYISGRTGKVVGKHPKSIASKVKKAFKIIGVLGLIALLFYFFTK